MSDLKIEPGKFYRLRNGMKYRCYAVDGGGSHPIHGAILSDDEWYTRVHHATGALLNNGESGDDIIAEWHDAPVVNWDLFPPHIVCLAMNWAGMWFAYTSSEIFPDAVDWVIDEKKTYHWRQNIHGEDTPKFTGDWRDSKVVRPGHEEDGE